MNVLFGDLLPGETPIDDVAGLKIPGITTRGELSRAEADGIRKALRKYFAADALTSDLAPFDFDWARRLHGEMFGDVWEWAGRFRPKDVNIGVPFGQVQERLYNLLDDLAFWDQHGMDPVEQAARLHHRAVEIHPFVSGNGRWGRLSTNIWLGLRDHRLIAWPEHLIGEVSPIRGDYIAALRAADGGDLDPLVAMHRRHIEGL